MTSTASAAWRRRVHLTEARRAAIVAATTLLLGSNSSGGFDTSSVSLPGPRMNIGAGTFDGKAELFATLKGSSPALVAALLGDGSGKCSSIPPSSPAAY